MPCLFPPVTVDGGRYMDGGVRSRTNADLAAGCDPVVVLAPRTPLHTREGLREELDAVARSSASVVLATPDPGSAEAMGPNVFDTRRWTPVLDAGLAQGHRLAAEIGPIWDVENGASTPSYP